jgi:hypothetical protein
MPPDPSTSLARQRTFRTPVRGYAFAPRPAGATGPATGAAVTLVREPDNPADPYAVAVWASEPAGAWRVGYLDRSVAAWVAPRMDAGLMLDGQVEGWLPEPDARWRRPLLRVEPAGRTDGRSRSGVEIAVREPMPRPPGVRRRVRRR